MTATLSQAQQYAKLKGTKVIDGAYKIADDHKSITFVLESGPKLTMTGEELTQEIENLEKAYAKEQAILNITTDDNTAGKPKAAKPKAAKQDSDPTPPQ